MFKDLKVLKIGGSVITDKKQWKKAKPREIQRISVEIASAFKEKPFKLVLIHGAGSYGHPLVDEMRKEKLLSSPLKFSEVVFSVSELNHLFLKHLLANKLPCVQLKAVDLVKLRNGEIASLQVEPVKECLERGLIPVLHGDMALDEKLTFNVASGDMLAEFIAARLKAEELLFGTDVDGLYTSDPKLGLEAQFISEVNKGNLNELLGIVSKEEFYTSNSTDVTGRMPKKFRYMVKAAKQGVKCVVFNACKPSMVYRALRGEKIRASYINLTS